jgi:EF-P beta-lysylation protein EpmB
MSHDPKIKQSWQQELVEAVTNVHELIDILGLEASTLNIDPNNSFPVRVPKNYISRMRKGDPQDPLLLQVLPQMAERLTQVGFIDDPLNEQAAIKQMGLLHKYHNRILLITTGSCAINCRFCFRRQFPYQDQQVSRQQMQSVLDYLMQHPDVNEVILSGGDPLVLKDERIRELMNQLSDVPTLKYLRFHTRLPVSIPSRLTPGFITLLKESRFRISLVIHANHPNEISDELGERLQALTQAGMTVLNQSVLLKNINNHPDTLITLSQRLYQYQVLPYYLHLLDPVHGTAHFAVDDDEAKNIMNALRATLSGYLVPKLVREIAGETSKTWVI